jgi:hypothetical protein
LMKSRVVVLSDLQICVEVVVRKAIML